MNLLLKLMVVLVLAAAALGCGKAKKQYSQADLTQVVKEDPNPNMRYWAARELGKIPRDQAGPSVEALTQALGDREELVRAGAAYGLGDLGPAAASAKPALNRASRDQAKQVREAVAYALKQIDRKK
jgi:HEAT repeat protein